MARQWLLRLVSVAALIAVYTLVAKVVAEQHSGNATFEAMEQGSRLAMVVMRRS